MSIHCTLFGHEFGKIAESNMPFNTREWGALVICAKCGEQRNVGWRFYFGRPGCVDTLWDKYDQVSAVSEEEKP
jgi:hypothetical protein